MSDVSLILRRTIRATPERLFAAWTEPEQLRQWWGPKHVNCTAAEVDLRVGGRYRLANEFPDGSVWWISGIFESVTPPNLLVYSWELAPGTIAPGGAQPPQQAVERITVRFEPRGDVTEVTVQHERVADEAARDEHEQGWIGCLDGLEELVAKSG